MTESIRGVTLVRASITFDVYCPGSRDTEVPQHLWYPFDESTTHVYILAYTAINDRTSTAITCTEPSSAAVTNRFVETVK
jgi:hypothetical protein